MAQSSANTSFYGDNWNNAEASLHTAITVGTQYRQFLAGEPENSGAKPARLAFRTVVALPTSLSERMNEQPEREKIPIWLSVARVQSVTWHRASAQEKRENTAELCVHLASTNRLRKDQQNCPLQSRSDRATPHASPR